AGVVWAFLKWYFKCRDKREELLEGKSNWIDMHGDASFEGKSNWIDMHGDASWAKHVNNSRPKAKDNKSRIMRWIGYWPTSMIWTLLDDFLTRVVRTVYNHISTCFEKISK